MTTTQYPDFVSAIQRPRHTLNIDSSKRMIKGMANIGLTLFLIFSLVFSIYL